MRTFFCPVTMDSSRRPWPGGRHSQRIMNKEKKTSLSISVYLRWPLILAGFVFIMNLLLVALSPETAIFMALFTIIFIGVAVWLYFY